MLGDLNISYNDMQQKIERLQAQLEDLKGKSKDTPCVSDTLDPLSQKLDDENVELEINPTMNSRVDNFVPNKHVKASISTKPITVSQPHAITKKAVNSNNQKHTSSACNNIKLDVRNEKPEVVCATCKQCLITANHDECVFKYVNGMNSSKKNQSVIPSESVNQMKHKAHVKKSKKLGSEERLASLRPSKPRTCLRWLPTGRIFDLSGTITESSNTESESDTSMCDNASASNHQEPTSKGFPNSTSFLDSQNCWDLPRDTPLDRIEVLRAIYNEVMSNELIYKGNNFVGVAKNLNIFVGCNTYFADFVVLEDVSEFIEKGLIKVLLGRPFKDLTRLEEMILERFGADEALRRNIQYSDPARTVPVPETFHEQTDDELTEAEIKQMEADDQAI
ncbi:hypothetical protein Tco_0596339 [Tanacetum coccineum]